MPLTDSWLTGNVFAASDENAVAAQINRNTARAVNPLDPEFGAVGDGSTDDTTALQDALAALDGGNGGVLVLPYGFTFKYSDTLAVPDGVIVKGAGRPGAGFAAPSSLFAGHADALIQLGNYSGLENVKVDGNGVGNWGMLCGPGPTVKPWMRGVYVADFVEAAYVFESTQNGVFIDCTSKDAGVGYALYNGAQNLEFYGCSDDNNSDVGGANHRSILIANSADARLVGTVFADGNRDCRWTGGIYEYGTGDYTVEILAGSTAGSFLFTGSHLCDNAGSTSTVHVDGYTGDVVLRDLTFGGTLSSQVVTAATGNIKFLNVQGVGTVGGRNRNLMALTTLSGTATATYGDSSETLLKPAEMTFQTGIGGWTNFGATVSWNATKRRLSLTSTDVGNGVFVLFSGGFNDDYARQYGLIRMRFTIANANHNVRLSMANTTTGVRTVAAYASGSYDVTYELLGDETGFFFHADSAVSTSAEICLFRAEHVL